MWEHPYPVVHFTFVEMPQHSQITAPQLLLKMQRREKIHVVWSGGTVSVILYFPLALLKLCRPCSPPSLVKMILLTVRQPSPGRGRRGPQGQPVSKLFAKSPGLPGTSSPPQCVWILNYLFAFADLLISQEFEWFFVLKTLSRTNMRHNWIHFLR